LHLLLRLRYARKEGITAIDVIQALKVPVLIVSLDIFLNLGFACLARRIASFALIKILALNAISDTISMTKTVHLARKTAINVRLVVSVRYAIQGILFHHFQGSALDALRVALHAQKMKSVLPARMGLTSLTVNVFLALQTALHVVIKASALNAKIIFHYLARFVMPVRGIVRYALIQICAMCANQGVINWAISVMNA